MSSTAMACLHNLPVELLHLILQSLDSETILLSFRYVCRRFYLITEVFNRYRLDLHACTKANFYRLCRTINPSNILALTLSDDETTPGQIGLFLKHFQLAQFQSLRALTLLAIGDSNLLPLLRDLSHSSLRVLTIKSRTFFTWTTPTLASLSTILEQSSLKQLTFSIWCFEIYDFFWPNQCFVEYLHISNRITFEQYCTILERCLNLQTFIIKDVLWNDPTIIPSVSYQQLKSLTLADNRMDISRLEPFFSLTPSLTYLKVIGMAYLNDTDPWEKILRTQLPHLDRFEFFFLSWKNVNYDIADIQSLIKPYQTSFWLENKRWIVNCDYILQPMEVMLYSLPICHSHFQYYHPSNKISCSNVLKTNLDQSTTMNKVSSLRLNLVKTIIEEEHMETEMESMATSSSSASPVFANVTELIVDLDGKLPMSLCSSLSQLINLSSLTQFQLNINYDLATDAKTTEYLIDFFRHTSRIHTLEICNNLTSIHFNTTIEDLCLIVPRSIQHLTITVKNINEMKVLFDRLEFLSSITFRFSFVKSIPSAKIIESFLNIRKDLTYRKNDCSIQVWLNKS